MSPQESYIETLKARLQSNLVIDSSGCWLRQSRLNQGGYTEITTILTGKKVTTLAHRLSYQLFVGPIPKDTNVCHKCDVRHCINPEHLFLGTHKDNVHDAVKKGRHPKGVTNGRHKLTEDNVREIRRLSGNWPVRWIAEWFGVDSKGVRKLLNGQTWSHVT